jgi:hypothetical protein
MRRAGGRGAAGRKKATVCFRPYLQGTSGAVPFPLPGRATVPLPLPKRVKWRLWVRRCRCPCSSSTPSGSTSS